MKIIIVISIVVCIALALDLYLWWVLKKTMYASLSKWILPVSTFLLFLSFFIAFRRAAIGEHNGVYSLNFFVGVTFGALIAKLLMFTFFFTEDVVRSITYLVERIFSPKPVSIGGRRQFVRTISLSVASIPLLGVLWGVTKGKYAFMVNRMNLVFDNLPKAFDGFKIVQFTDFHAGSFDDYKAVQQGLEMLQKEEGDIIVFTGDLVNNRADEFLPFIEMWKQLKAPDGKFAILGNHDYGDYMPWKTEGERERHLNQIQQMYDETNFTLLLNEHIILKKDGEQIALLGVQNWGKPPFPQYGKIEQTIGDLDENMFKVLLSHDPDHWEYEIHKLKTTIDLTLSGHTHGAQFGVDIPGFKWSPVQYRFKRWLGLYEENKRKLYVNRGFGFLGFPGRVGMHPEISVFTLKSKEV